MATPEQFRIDQVVHGYRDGHRQLAGSLVLDVEATDVMALASDLLTSRSLRIDESYITGYPIKSEHKYVFARTWPAPEMSRPGCVWTHSLVVDYPTVSKIEDPDVILSLFERPSLATLNRYFSPLTFGESAGDSFPIVPADYADEVVQAMYGRRWSRSEVTLVCRGADQDAHTVIAIWAQLPPRLRRATILCTALSATTLSIESDLTIRFSERPDPSPCYTDKTISADSENFRGMRLLATDLTRRYTTPLRQFLRRYSVDVIEPLSAMGALAQVFLLLRNTNRREEFRTVAGIVGRTFPKTHDAQVLKQDLLLGRFFGQATMMTDRRANSLLGTLDAIREGSLAMLLSGELAKDIAVEGDSWLYLFTSLLELHVAFSGSEFVDSCIRSIAGNMSLTTLASLEVGEQQALSLSAIRPELLAEAAFWSRHAESRTKLVRAGAMDAASITCFFHVFRDDLKPWDIEALLEREPDVTITSIAALWKEDAASERDSQMLVQLLGRRSDMLSRAITMAGWLPRVAWQDLSSALASGSLVSVSSTIWARILKRARVARLSHQESTLAAHLFVAGLVSPPVTARVLLSVSFDLLYVTAWNGKLSTQECEVLDKKLPGAQDYWAWDYCRRLSQALLDQLLSADSLETILRMEVEALAIKGIVGELKRRHDAEAVLRDLSQRLNAVPEARRKWGKAIKDAIEPRTIFGFFQW